MGFLNKGSRDTEVEPVLSGPTGGPLSKNGIEITDSAYVAVSMRVMTRTGTAVLDSIKRNGGQFVKCLHSVGVDRKSVV